LHLLTSLREALKVRGQNAMAQSSQPIASWNA
jgi:hypothetical protein